MLELQTKYLALGTWYQVLSSWYSVLTEFTQGELFPISFAKLLISNEFVSQGSYFLLALLNYLMNLFLGELFPISIQGYTTVALGCLLNYLMNLFRAISYQLLGLHWRHTSSYDQSFILRQQFHSTTRVSSYDQSFILREEFHPTTRVGWLENIK